jgi:hypothetical protein
MLGKPPHYATGRHRRRPIKMRVRPSWRVRFVPGLGKRFLLTPNSAKHPLVVSLRTFDQRCSLCPWRHENSRSRSSGDNQLKCPGEPMKIPLVNEQGSNAAGKRTISLRLEHLGTLERVVRDYGFKDRSHFFQLCTDALIKAHGDGRHRLDWPPRFVLRD